MTEEVKNIEEALRRVFGEGSDAGVVLKRIPLICQDIKGIHSELKDINDKLDTKIVTKDQFWPVKTLVYGATATTLIAVIGAIVALVVRSHG